MKKKEKEVLHNLQFTTAELSALRLIIDSDECDDILHESGWDDDDDMSAVLSTLEEKLWGYVVDLDC